MPARFSLCRRLLPAGLLIVVVANSAVAQPAPPPPVIRQQSTEIQVINGRRTITVKRDQETIVIKDENGKNISVKHTRQVDGVEKTDLYEAESLDALTQKHPKGADLYRQAITPKAVAPLQRMREQLNPGAMPPKLGDRKIRAIVGGRIVEIADQHGEKIRMRMRPRTPQDAPVQEYTAENYAELQKLAPEAAVLYERLAGFRWRTEE